jgi:signal recognition particle subunit SRP54
MLDKLGSVLKKSFDKIAGSLFLDKKQIEEIVKELQRALIIADVNVYLVKELGERIKKEAADEKIKGIEKKEHLIKILHDEIINLLGGEKQEISVEKHTKIMLLGLYGAGKTTTTSKLAAYYSKRGKKVCILGLDVHRPAASDQLEQLGKQVKVPIFIDKSEKNAIKLYKKFESKLKEFDLVIIDTAGRHDLDKELVDEIKDLKKLIDPDYTILTIQADIGQAAKNQAHQFQDACNINGVIITRMDSTAKAGGALTACNETHAPVFFIGTGEKPSDFETFNPKSFVSRILGLGDLEGLLEKVQSAVDEKSQKKLKDKLEKGNFDLRDLQDQLKSMQGLGSLSKIAEMIPGLGKAKIPENMLDNQESKLKKWQHAIDSMTEEEIQNPEVLEKQTSRLSRIAKGSGTTTSEIRQLIKQYKMLKEMVSGTGDLSNMDPSQGLNQKQMMKLAKKFGKRMKF